MASPGTTCCDRGGRDEGSLSQPHSLASGPKRAFPFPPLGVLFWNAEQHRSRPAPKNKMAPPVPPTEERQVFTSTERDKGRCAGRICQQRLSVETGRVSVETARVSVVSAAVSVIIGARVSVVIGRGVSVVSAPVSIIIRGGVSVTIGGLVSVTIGALGY